MEKDQIKFYPVDNGDSTLIKLKDNTTILFDCKFRTDEINSSGYEIFDVKKDLLKSIEYRNKLPFVDLFGLTHPDHDHCKGFENNFHIGDPSDYNDKNYEKIVIDELWVTPILFSNNLGNDDAIALRKEAKRRKFLYDNNDEKRNTLGNRLRIIGYNGVENLENVPHYHPGDIISNIAGSTKNEFSFFIHAPLKADLIEGQAEKDRNSTSIVAQARFGAENSYNARMIIGGDADHYRWEKILEKTEKHNNQEALKWDLFLAPHHCSWTYFNNVPYGENSNKEPQDYSVRLLKEYHLADAKVIASSKIIKNNDDNPPHYKAKEEYIKHIGGQDQFISLAESPKPSSPKPVIFEVDLKGLKRVDDNSSSTKDKMDAATTLGSTSIVTGNWGGTR